MGVTASGVRIPDLPRVVFSPSWRRDPCWRCELFKQLEGQTWRYNQLTDEMFRICGPCERELRVVLYFWTCKKITAETLEKYHL